VNTEKSGGSAGSCSWIPATDFNYVSQDATAIAMIILVVASPTFAENDSNEDQIRKTRIQYNEAIARHDVPGIISILDEEYQITTSLGQLSQGRDKESIGWHELFASRQELLYVRSPESIEVSDDYPLAAESGTWIGSWLSDDGPVQTGGRYAAMWRRVEGEWKVRSELFVALFCEGVGCP
jgi:ketosteroid isomerase-like protein